MAGRAAAIGRAARRVEHARQRTHVATRPGGSPHRALFHIQRTAGNASLHRLLHAGAIRPKLTIGPADDDYEREADRVADDVMRMPVAVPPVSISRKCAECEEDEQKRQQEPLVQAKPAGQAAPTLTDDIAAYVQNRPGHGRPLDPATRSDMETRFGHDFGVVRVHDDGAAAASARAIDARAYTFGHDIVFGAGQFAPTTAAGRRLLAHELTHVRQQTGGTPIIRAQPDDPAALGRAFEPMDVEDWKAELRKQGYTEFHSKGDGFKGWAKDAFTDKRARPDLIAVDHTRKRVLVGDVTAGPWSPADQKPGHRRPLPNELGEDDPYRRRKGGHKLQKHAHLSKTVDDGRQAARNLPPTMQDYQVASQDRYWQTGKKSKVVVVKKAGAPGGAARPGAGGSKSAGTVGGGTGKVRPAVPRPTSRFGKVVKGARGVVKGLGRGAARIFPFVVALGPLFELSDALAAFDTAKARVEELKRNLDAVWAEVEKMLKESRKSSPQPPVTRPAPPPPPTPSPEPPEPISAKQTIRLYELAGRRLTERVLEVPTERLATSYVETRFESLTKANEHISNVPPSQYDCPAVLKGGRLGLRDIHNFDGYSTLAHQQKLRSILRTQLESIRALCALSQVGKGGRRDEPVKPDGDEISVSLDWWIGEAVTISATCQGPDAAGNWTCSSEGDFQKLRAVTESEAPEYQLQAALTRRLAGTERSWNYSLTAYVPDPATEQWETSSDGSLPPDACDPSRYPSGSVLAYILEHYGGNCQ